MLFEVKWKEEKCFRIQNFCSIIDAVEKNRIEFYINK